MKTVAAALILAAGFVGFLLGQGSAAGKDRRERPAIPAAAAPAPAPVALLTPQAPPGLKPPAVAAPARLPALRDLLHSKDRIARLSGLLDRIAKADSAGMREILSGLAAAFDGGFIESRELVLLTEALGQRGDPATLEALLKSPFSKDSAVFAQAFFHGWAGKNARAAFDYLTSRPGKLEDKELSAIAQGLSSGAYQEEALLKKLAIKYPRAAGLIEYGKVEGRARQEGFAASMARALTLPDIKNSKGDSDAQSEKWTSLLHIGELARGTSDAAVLEYTDTAVREEKHLGFNAIRCTSRLAMRDHRLAWQYGRNLPEGDMRNHILGSSVFNAAMKNPDEAIEMVKNAPRGSYGEQWQLIQSLQDAFRQTDKVSKEELPDLIRQTEALHAQLKASEPH